MKFIKNKIVKNRKQGNKSSPKRTIESEKSKNSKTTKMPKICVQSPEVVMTGE